MGLSLLHCRLSVQPSRELDKAGASVALDANGGTALVGVPGRNQALAMATLPAGHTVDHDPVPP